MRTNMFIGRTNAFYCNNEDEPNTLPTWIVSEDISEITWDFHELTEEGYDIYQRWCMDKQAGYDLYYGRAKGLADEFSDEGMYEELTKYYSTIVEL